MAYKEKLLEAAIQTRFPHNHHSNKSSHFQSGRHPASTMEIDSNSLEV